MQPKWKKEDEPKPTIEQELTLRDALESMAVPVESDMTIQPTTSVELTHEMVQQMFDPDNLDMITDLTEKQIQGLLKMSILNHILFDGKESVLTIFMTTFKRLNISKYRLSRKEMVKAIFSTNGSIDDETATSRFKRFF